MAPAPAPARTAATGARPADSTAVPAPTTRTQRLHSTDAPPITRPATPAGTSEQLASARLALFVAQPELLHLHLQALAADLEQPRRLGDVAAGLVERLDDQ